MYDLWIKNGVLVTADYFRPVEVAIREGKFSAFLEPGTYVESRQIIDAEGKLLFPGIIDCHAHLNEPGFEYREDFESGTKAAAVAGCTMLIDMPLNNNPPLINREAFDFKYEKCSGHSYVDFAFWGGLIGDEEDDSGTPERCNLSKLKELNECGVVGFKAFTCPNGSLFPAVNMGQVRLALENLKSMGTLAGFHCEDYGLIHELEKYAKAKKNRSRSDQIRDFLDSHDVWSELLATKNILDMSRASGGQVHICHVSHPTVAQAIKEAIADGVRVTAETCPHYLAFSEDLLFEKGVAAKCTPPLRTKEDVSRLWDYVLDGTLSCISSDHSPAADYEKDPNTLDVWSAWGGLNTIQYFLPLVFDLFVHQKKLSPIWIARLLSKNPAKIFGLSDRKGAFELGLDADVVIVDPDKKWKVDKSTMLTKGKVSCLEGMEGKGAAIRTLIRGETVAENGAYIEKARGYGQFIKANR